MPASDARQPLSFLPRAQLGDPDVQMELLEKYRNYLAILARLEIGRQLQTRVSASDVVQDVLLQAHQGFTAFRGATEEELIAWLRKILASQLAMQLRRHFAQKRDLRLEQRMEMAIEQSSQDLAAHLAAPTASPSEAALRREQAVLLADALEKLPLQQREILLLRHMEHFTFPQIAVRLGQDLESVKSAWRRAVKKLRELVAE